MFSWLKKKHKEANESEVLQQGEANYTFLWYEIGEGNPFNKRILDIRSFTLSMIATTSRKEIAEKYTSLRSSVGNEYIGIDVPNSKSSLTNLKYPHNGSVLRGAAFKADSMDCKWDIYVYDNIFYFSRSWTGDLVYKATAKINVDSIELTNIEYPSEIDESIAINDVHFLMMSHAFSRVFPHMIPGALRSENEIARYSFSAFGNKACYASYEPVIDTVVTLK
ncbi:MAG TPA: hypothetical protein VIU12_34565 [Chryseolinea sp.]